MYGIDDEREDDEGRQDQLLDGRLIMRPAVKKSGLVGLRRLHVRRLCLHDA